MPPTAPLPQGAEKTRAVRAMFDTIAPRYETVNRLMTLGLDRRWRHRLVRDLRLPAGSRVLDVATGTGDLVREATRQGLVAVGADLSYGMLQESDGPRIEADVAALPIRTASFDGLTCGYGLRNFTDLNGACREMARVLRPGGRLALLEVAEPAGGLWRAGFRVWFRHLVPHIGGLLSDRAAYQYLPASTAYLPPAEELRTLLVAAGFSSVNHQLLMGGLSQIFLATRRS